VGALLGHVEAFATSSPDRRSDPRNALPFRRAESAADARAFSLGRRSAAKEPEAVIERRAFACRNGSGPCTIAEARGRSNIQYLDSSIFVQLCPEYASRMTIRSIGPRPSDPACDEITYQPLEPSIANREPRQIVIANEAASSRVADRWAFRPLSTRRRAAQSFKETLPSNARLRENAHPAGTRRHLGGMAECANLIRFKK
jgi:hypothetical protein